MNIKDLFREPTYPIRLYDSNGNNIYYENSKGNWYKYEFDSNRNVIYYENSDGYWNRYEYDSNSKVIYHEDSDRNWYKKEYDSNGDEIYYEDSGGTIRDNRPKTELTMDEIAEKFGRTLQQFHEIAEKFGIDVKNLKIKK